MATPNGAVRTGRTRLCGAYGLVPASSSHLGSAGDVTVTCGCWWSLTESTGYYRNLRNRNSTLLPASTHYVGTQDTLSITGLLLHLALVVRVSTLELHRKPFGHNNGNTCHM